MKMSRDKAARRSSGGGGNAASSAVSRSVAQQVI